MRIGIYDPYLNTLGGGERYVLTIASCLSKNHQVFLFWDDKTILKKASDRFGLKFEEIKIEKNIFSKDKNFISRILKTKQFDLIIYLSDGSIPFLLSKKNILLFQFPVNWVNGKSFLTKFKFRRINNVLCYSAFVKTFLDKTFSTNSIVLPPAINDTETGKTKKENIILTVGRFTKAVNTKKQEVLIDVFKKMCDEGLLNWRFIVIGSVLPEDKSFVEDLRVRANNYPIDILDNVSFEKLNEHYKRAKIYWHAAGFGEDLKIHPERAEHFGISTVEAMNKGMVPVVINAGGQQEIIDDNENGFLWLTIEELTKKSLSLIKDEKLWAKISFNAIKKSKFYSIERFCERLNEIINK